MIPKSLEGGFSDLKRKIAKLFHALKQEHIMDIIVTFCTHNNSHIQMSPTGVQGQDPTDLPWVWGGAPLQEQAAVLPTLCLGNFLIDFNNCDLFQRRWPGSTFALMANTQKRRQRFQLFLPLIFPPPTLAELQQVSWGEGFPNTEGAADQAAQGLPTQPWGGKMLKCSVTIQWKFLTKTMIFLAS